MQAPFQPAAIHLATEIDRSFRGMEREFSSSLASDRLPSFCRIATLAGMPVIVDPTRVRAFRDAVAFEKWLTKNHDRETELWIKIHKKASGLKSITPVEAIDVCLCWGWIDGIRKGLDETSFLQRYTPRGRKSVWSKVNVGNVARLITEGRMTEHGQRHVDAAQADGRWDRAYRSKDTDMPTDLQNAIDANAKARAMLATLTARNRFALVFRTNEMKTPAGRAKKIANLVEMLARGETIHPQKTR